jgi:hypothetical protein
MKEKAEHPKECYICKGELEFLGQIPVRAYGTGPVARLLFGQWAEVGEETLPIDLFRCKKCGHLDIYDLDFSLNEKKDEEENIPSRKEPIAPPLED